GTHHWRSGDISGAPVMSRLFNIMRGGRVHLDVPKGIEFPVGIRTLLNTSRYVTTCTSGLSSLKSTMSRLVFWASVPPFRMSLLCDLARLVVADVRREDRDRDERVSQVLVDHPAVRLDAPGAVLVERDTGVGDELDGLEQVVEHHGLEDVELEVSLRAGEGHR